MSSSREPEMNRHPLWLWVETYRWLEADRRRWWLAVVAGLITAGQLIRSSP